MILSGVTCKGVSVLISLYTGAVGVNLPSMVEYTWGVSSLGLPLFHSFHFNVEASSRATKLGVSPVKNTLEDGTLFHSPIACLKICIILYNFISYFITYCS